MQWPFAQELTQSIFGGSTFEADPIAFQQRPGQGPPGYAAPPQDKRGFRVMPLEPPQGQRGPPSRAGPSRPGPSRQGERPRRGDMYGPMEPMMPLGHQYSFEERDHLQKREAASSCCCCWSCYWQVCSFLALAVALALFAVYSAASRDSTVQIHGTEFTLWNYAVPQLRFFLDGESDTVAMTGWYADLARTDPLVGDGPGPNTRTYYGYKTVKGMLQGFGRKIKEGTFQRANELGMQILRADMWPETGRILFGYDNADHATVRPYLGDTLDGAEKPEEQCDGSACWNSAWLRSVFQKRFAGLSSFSSDDLQWIITIVLHKVHLNIDLSDAEAQRFADFQVALMRVIAFPRNDLWETVLGAFPTELRKQYMTNYQAAIASKWPEVDWSIVQVKATLLANAMLDSIALHAGPTVSGALEHLLAILYMEGDPGNALIRPLQSDDEAGIRDLIWEVLRRYPPVAGVPYWELSKEDGVTWAHKIPNLQMALQDASIFFEPMAFRLRRPGLSHANSSLSIGFAEFALVDNDLSHRDSHACPGKNLTLALLQAFLQEFTKHQWKADSSNIKLNSYSTSGFTLRKLA